MALLNLRCSPRFPSESKDAPLSSRLRVTELRRANSVTKVHLSYGMSSLRDGDPSSRSFTSGSRRRAVLARASTSNGEVPVNTLGKQVLRMVHLTVSLGLFLGLDKALKKLFLSASIKFPSALFGMFCIFTLLNILDSVSPKSAARVISFCEPATTFIQRWLPLFYVPSLVLIPIATQGIPPSDGLKIGSILVFGWVASLAVAGYTAVAIRRVVRTKLEPTEPTAKSAPFSATEVDAWTGILIVSFALVAWSPTALGTFPATAMPFFISATVLGYMLGSRCPEKFKKVLHPILTCALSADLAAYGLGKFTKKGFFAALNAYLTKSSADPGAGDILMGFLGSVILSFSFSMFKQRKLVKRHAAEIFSAVITASLFSMYSTALAGRFLGLDGQFTRAIVPRCVTVALALPISTLLEAQNQSLTAAAVVMTGLVGANFAQTVMEKLGLDDPIARGMATAASAHGLGTAALSAQEPEALPFCAIAYALTGIISSLISAVPVVQQSLIYLTG